MPAPAARRLSALTITCAHCARHTVRPVLARRRQWPAHWKSSSRRWYADNATQPPPPPPSVPKEPAQSKEAASKDGDVATAVQDVVEELEQQPPEQDSKPSLNVPAAKSDAATAQSSDLDAIQSPLTGDVLDSDDQASIEEASEPNSAGAADDPTESALQSDDARIPIESAERSAASIPEQPNTQLNPEHHSDVEDLETSEDAETDDLPEGAVLVSEVEEEDEVLEDILGSIDTETSAVEPVSLDTPTHTERRSRSTGKADEGFWNYTAAGAGDAEYLKDNVTSLGHDELEQQREYREYARLAAWELPLLSKLAKHFSPPTKSEFLRFRYTSYLGEEHPAAAKVVLEFAPSDLPSLTQIQQDKLIKLLGVRYNPSTKTAKMSCESYQTQAQNKQYLLDRVRDLLKEARDPTDTFEDVPFDFRHHKPKKWHEFPKEWIMTEERMQALMDKRRDVQALEQQQQGLGRLIDGSKIIQRTLEEPAREPQRVIVNRATGKPVAPRRRQ